MRKGPENKYVVKLIEEMQKAQRPFWKRIAYFLSRPRKKRVTVNVSKISRYANEGMTVVVPGKVLGDGKINFPVVVVAQAFSKSAIKEIKEGGGTYILLEEFFNKNKDSKSMKDVMIIV